MKTHNKLVEKLLQRPGVRAEFVRIEREEAVNLSPELCSDLDSRTREFEANPEAGFSWDEVKARARTGTWRTSPDDVTDAVNMALDAIGADKEDEFVGSAARRILKHVGY